jgi:short-subunit dehydrogenase
MMTDLSGKYVLLTGGSRGIGPVIAEALAAHGAHIALAARSEEGLRQAVAGLNRYSVKTMIMPVDLAQSEQRQELVKTVIEQFGQIDILVNNAGLESEGAFAGLNWETIDETFEVNLLAPIELTHLVLPHMLDRKQGHVVNIASTAAKSGAPYAAVYSGTKAGLAEWTRGLRLELAGSGVHFTTICPGYVTEVGMFARFGMPPPWMVGSCTPAQVAQAVVKAIQKERREVIVNSRPAWPVFAINEISPAFGDWLMKRLGVVDFQRRKVGDKARMA